MPDRLNKHVSQNSPTLDPTVDESDRVAFQKAREEAIAIDFIRIGGRRYTFPGDFFDAFRAGVEAAATLPRAHRIGVFDYDSLVECLKSNFESTFRGESFRDPQDAIQRMGAEVVNCWGALVRARAILKSAHYTPPLDEHDPLNDATKAALVDIDAALSGYPESGTESSANDARMALGQLCAF